MAFSPDQYELLDFGRGRKLERFASLVLDRPCPAAQGKRPARPEIWSQADARFVRGESKQGVRGESKQGEWRSAAPLPDSWIVSHGAAKFILRASPFGHVGLFPEQADNWDWVAQRIGEAERPLKTLNLFAYTGGGTLAVAAALRKRVALSTARLPMATGAEVVHLDAARNMVDRARASAELSGLGDAPIRWITDDAQKFVRREVRRGGAYNALILDPPSYGHGARGEVWRLKVHLPRLLHNCRELVADRLGFVVLSCHTPGYDADRLRSILAEAFGLDADTVEAFPMRISDTDGRALPSGFCARWAKD